MDADHPPDNSNGRVVSLRSRRLAPRGLPREKKQRNSLARESWPVADLREYEISGIEDYRHRMVLNIATMGIAVVLIVMGVWFAKIISHS